MVSSYQNLSPYELLISADNFKHAWVRVRYFDRPDSRDWIGLKVFAANRDYNLEVLRQSLIERTFEPSFPEVKYIPKSSLTLRPMAILAIGDRIIFQAIANVISEKGRFALSMVSNRQSFSNVLAEPNQQRMFVHWKHQYRLFQDRFCELMEEGNTWLAETDFAAFYETIDHSILFQRLLDGKFLDNKSLEYIESYLPIWSSVKGGMHVSRGIPQGCLASDLLANVFLYEFDKNLAVQEYHYLRYVDDIRILGKTKDVVQRGLIKIDITLKSIGLLLQTKKTMVRQVTDIAEEVDLMLAQLSELDQRLNEPDLGLPVDPLLQPSMQDVALLGEDLDSATNHPSPLQTTQQELIALFRKSKKSIDSGDGDPFAERHFRFCLYRLLPNVEIINAILPYFTELPWLSELIAFYLRKCKLGKKAIKHLHTVIETHNVYDNVVALAIDILIRQGVSLRSQHNLFRQWLTDDKRDWPLLSAGAIALGESSDNMAVLVGAMKSASPSVRRMATIQALRLARNQGEAGHVLRASIDNPSPVVIDALLYQLYNEWGLTLKDLELDEQSLTDYCRLCAKGYDNTLPTAQPDYIRHVFDKDYEIKFSDSIDFHALLGTDHQRASYFLWQAQNSYYVNSSRYVSQLDLFHEELLYPIMVDKLGLKSTRDELAKVELTDRLATLKKNTKELATFCGAMITCHHMRANPETHTRLHHELTVTTPITWRQRDGLKMRLRGGYQELVDWITAGCPK
jgi:retron-type reverse transcriptase